MSYWRFAGGTPTTELANVKRGLRNKAVRVALNKAASPVKAAVIDAAPADTGSLKRSFRIKVKAYRGNTKWVVVITPSPKFQRKGKYPAKYNVLVNRGTKFFKGRHHIDRVEVGAFPGFKNTFDMALREQIRALTNR